MKKLLELFRTPSPKMLAQRELEDAQRQHLNALSAAEYATRLSQYHADRIKRLSAYIKEDA
jgi:hypothetical protein